ncbi:MAG TPA: hypothetical protein VFY71_00730 [Planctomycetota bacterium]|nr:hypothetical protein [Planctomycetota bacterium]
MKLVHLTMVCLLAFAAGWIGYMLGEQRLELSDLRDSQTALLEGLSRQVDDLAQRFDGERTALADDGSSDAAEQMDAPATAAPAAPSDPMRAVAVALTSLQSSMTEMSHQRSGMAGLDAVSAAPRDEAALAAWAGTIGRDPGAWRACFGWSYARALSTFGAPDSVSPDGGAVCWTYTPASASGFTLSFVDGGLVGAWASAR